MHGCICMHVACMHALPTCPASEPLPERSAAEESEEALVIDAEGDVDAVEGHESERLVPHHQVVAKRVEEEGEGDDERGDLA